MFRELAIAKFVINTHQSTKLINKFYLANPALDIGIGEVVRKSYL